MCNLQIYCFTHISFCRYLNFYLKQWNVKQLQNVLHNLCYPKCGISATLVEVVFKNNKSTMQNPFAVIQFPLSLSTTFSCSYLATPSSSSNDSIYSLFYHSTYVRSRSFWGYNQSKRPQHSFVCSVAPNDGQLPLILSCWCSIDLVKIFVFVLFSYIDTHEHFRYYLGLIYLCFA